MREPRPTAPGFLVTLEGVEGGGKSTQAVLLEGSLREAGEAVLLTREPGGSSLAESIRGLLLDPANEGMAPLAELYLILAARAEHVHHVVRPALAEGRLVLIDRFSDATLAYQAGGRELPAPLVADLAAPAAGGLVPDVTFLLDLAPEQGLARRSVRARQRDRLEGESLAFHQRVRNAYLELARRAPARFVVVDASRDPESVHRIIHQTCRERLARAGWSANRAI